MFSALRHRYRAYKRYTKSAQFLGIAARHEQDATEHRLMILFHREAENHAKRMAKAARATAKKL